MITINFPSEEIAISGGRNTISIRHFPSPFSAQNFLSSRLFGFFQRKVFFDQDSLINVYKLIFPKGQLKASNFSPRSLLSSRCLHFSFVKVATTFQDFDQEKKFLIVAISSEISKCNKNFIQNHILKVPLMVLPRSSVSNLSMTSCLMWLHTFS